MFRLSAKGDILRQSIGDNLVQFEPLPPDNLENIGRAKIVGGEIVEIKDFPYIVWLNGCGGSLIAADWIVTATHCES